MTKLTVGALNSRNNMKLPSVPGPSKPPYGVMMVITTLSTISLAIGSGTISPTQAVCCKESHKKHDLHNSFPSAHPIIEIMAPIDVIPKPPTSPRPPGTPPSSPTLPASEQVLTVKDARQFLELLKFFQATQTVPAPGGAYPARQDRRNIRRQAASCGQGLEARL